METVEEAGIKEGDKKKVKLMDIDPKTGKDALQKLFDVLGPKYKERNGGYTRVIKTFNRRGDNAPMAILAFVD